MWRKSCQSCLFSESHLFIAGDQNFAKSRDVCIAFEKTISLKHRNEGSHSPMCYEKTGSYLGAEFPLAAGLHGAIIKPQRQRGLGNVCPHTHSYENGWLLYFPRFMSRIRSLGVFFVCFLQGFWVCVCVCFSYLSCFLFIFFFLSFF